LPEIGASPDAGDAKRMKRFMDNWKERKTMGLIVVGVDHSAGAREALRFALTEARLRGASLRAIHTWQHPYSGAGFGFTESAYRVGDLSELRSAAESALDATIEEAIPDASEVEIERRVIDGAPAGVLVDQSRDAELLVVGSRGLGGFRGLLLGSVSQQCAHHASCPVVIVHAPAADAGEE
jgi:nucleotide-binding universal stress UspA family protein